ncbi:LysR family transcriptional regulator [Spirochaeta africana]|uniref:HTH-type transcriptional regulator MetR n=1 Tax=Spirochaeta africana (strain ATCC 700263 / DSM 8902 / Z-7692) TaxID=889378 RepID=H9ULD1_SPIAZ|nr:LysR family transcriptional regulator [Spirochaeta africana]AFG38324.1 transcriptional regulator [Spirochaeta africana DSM 8902]
MLERVHLEIIDALDRTGSLTRAADQLNLTQPALTHSIRKLEGLTGATLWQREGRTLRLTQAGQHLLRSARQLLPGLQETEATLQAYGTGKRGRLRLGVECHPCFEWLVGIINGFLQAWEDVELDVTRQFQFDGLQALQERAIDLLVTPDHIPRDGLRYQSIHRYELQLLTAADHPLAGRPHIQPQDLAAETLLTYPIAAERLDVYTRFLNPAGIQPRERKIVETIEIMVQLAAAGRGVSTFPDWLIQRHARTSPVTGIRLGSSGIQKELYLVCREEDREIPYIQDFLERSRA